MMKASAASCQFHSWRQATTWLIFSTVMMMLACSRWLNANSQSRNSLTYGYGNLFWSSSQDLRTMPCLNKRERHHQAQLLQRSCIQSLLGKSSLLSLESTAKTKHPSKDFKQKQACGHSEMKIMAKIIKVEIYHL